eukprot:3941360-Rhodomonas_salina.2
MSGTELAYAPTLSCYAGRDATRVGSVQSGTAYARTNLPVQIYAALCRAIALDSADAMRGSKSAYAAICLRACYAMPGTGLAYAARNRVRYAMCGTELAYAAMRRSVCCYAASGTDIAYASARCILRRREGRSATLSAYARAMQCPRMLLPVYPQEGSSSRHGSLSPYGNAVRCAVLTQRMVLSLPAYARAMRCPRMLLCGMRYWPSVCCYAVCGTGLAYAATRCAVLKGRMLRRVCDRFHRQRQAGYAMSGTERLCGTVCRCPVLRQPMLLPGGRRLSEDASRSVCDVRYCDSVCCYWHSVCYYAMSGTGIAYVTTQCP